MRRRSTLITTITNEPAPGVYAPEKGEQDRPRVTRCCARCQRGIRGYGELPCGYPTGCPNPNCAHANPKENQS
jgi:hypothetical protein